MKKMIAALAVAALSGTIKIVSSLPRTGSAKGQSDTMVNAFKMALDEVNNKIGNATLVYDDMDDATPANTNRKVAVHFRRVALTRAKARVLRDALGVDLVSVEELDGE